MCGFLFRSDKRIECWMVATKKKLWVHSCLQPLLQESKVALLYCYSNTSLPYERLRGRMVVDQRSLNAVVDLHHGDNCLLLQGPCQERICVQIYTASVQTLHELRISFFWRGEETLYET